MRRSGAIFLLLALGVLAPARAEDEDHALRGEQFQQAGEAAFDGRDYETALLRFAKAQAAFEEAGEKREAVWALAWIGRSLQRARRYDRALAVRTEVLRRFREIHADADHLDVAQSLNNLAFAHAALGRNQPARALQKQALDMVERLFPGDHPETARCLGNYASRLALQGRLEEALDYHQRCLTMHRSLHSGDHEQIARGRSNLGMCLDDLGRSREALPHHQEALAMRERLHEKDHPSKSISLNNLARSLRFLGRTEEGFDLYQKSLAMRERLYPPNHPAISIAMNNLGRCLRAMGRPADAFAYHERAYEIDRAAFPRAHPNTARSLSFLGSCARELGWLGDALLFNEQALDMRRVVYTGDHPAVASSLNNLATCLAMLHRVEEAEKHFRAALEMNRRIAKGDTPPVAMGMLNLAGCLEDVGRYEDALELAQDSLAMLRRIHGDEHPVVALAWGQYASCLGGLGKDEEARQAFEHSILISRAVGDANTHRTAVELSRHLLVRMDRPAEAIGILTDAIAEIEALREGARGLHDVGRAVYFRHLMNYGALDLMIRAQVAVGQADRALAYVERGRARGFLDQLARSRFDPYEAALRRARLRGDEKTVEQMRRVAEERRHWLAELTRLDHALTARQGSRSGKREELRELKQALVQARFSFARVSRQRALLTRDLQPMARPEEPEALQRALSKDERMLVYSIQEDRAFAFLVPPAGQKIQVFPLHWPDGSALATRALTKAVLAHNASIVAADDAHLETGARLAEALLPEKVRRHLLEAARVFLVPHRVLHRLPFETLVLDAEKKQYWLDAGPALVYAPSGSVLQHCRRRADEQWDEPLPYDVVALGDPVFTRPSPGAAPRPLLPPVVALHRSGPLLALPGSRREVESIRDTMDPERAGTALVLLGEEATKARLMEAAPRASILHIATHQQIDERGEAGFSRLALTAPRVPDETDDGFLHLHELFEGWRDRLSACRLVVLSACETQRGPQQKDEGIYAITLGFVFAGCPSVVGSLWRVDDASTAELMGTFYRRLKGGEGKLEAFTNARKEVRAKHPHPFYWAPFIYVGDPR